MFKPSWWRACTEFHLNKKTFYDERRLRHFKVDAQIEHKVFMTHDDANENDTEVGTSFIDSIDSLAIPKRPTSPEEIVDDSFEGFLKNAFIEITGDPSTNTLLGFKKFYTWRKGMGIVYSEGEILDLFSSLIGESQEGLDLMGFIEINRVIDETNAAMEDSW